MKFEYRFPDIGEGIHEGTIIKWMVEVGDVIKEGDSVAEVETDKVTAEIPSARSGKVLELIGKEGQIIHVGEVFVVIDTESDGEDSTETGEKAKAADSVEIPPVEDEENIIDELDEKEEVVEEETAGVVGEVIASSEQIPPSTEGHNESPKKEVGKKVLATPVARAMAKDLSVDISTVKGTGPNGRVMKEDIKLESESAPKLEDSKSEVQSGTPAKQDRKTPVLDLHQEAGTEELYERIPLTRIRRTIAEKMTESRFTIPHTTAMDEIDISKLDELRKKYKDILKEEDVNLTYLPFIIKATIVALKALPEFNASLDEVAQELVLKHFYHIGIATDTDRGLMVPVLRNANSKSMVEIAREIVDLSSRAKENKMELHELKGSSFSITNYGSIGGHFGIPIINYPESAILGLGRVIKKPIVRDDEIVIATVLPLSLSYDHRIIDGAAGARFLNIMKDLLMDPEMLFIKS